MRSVTAASPADSAGAAPDRIEATTVSYWARCGSVPIPAGSPLPLGMAAFSREKSRPERVRSEILRAAAEAVERGPDPDRLRRTLRSDYGAFVRSLSSFHSLSSALCTADFCGYNMLDTFDMLGTVTAQEVRDFLAETISEERCAMSLITPPAGAQKGAKA